MPFFALLLSIAVFPLVPGVRDWWDRHHHKLALGLALGLVVLLYYGLRGYGVVLGDKGATTAPGWPTVRAVFARSVLDDYLSFVVLLFSLYVVTGGLQLRGNLVATPGVNTAFLGAGAVLANLIGTTGASMLLIRPLLHSNHERKHKRHTVVFFIFVVSNIGGCLLPLGPPLFLGYLRGVPFFWTLHLAAPWLFTVGVLLGVYFLWDLRAHRRETPADRDRDVRHRIPLRLHGLINLLWLLGIVLTVGLIVPGQALPGTGLFLGGRFRETVLLALAVLSLATTPRGLRRDAGFSYAAISEVACLFLGIFVTMAVPVEILRDRGAALGLSTPSQFFWAAGGLSSVLDNAPTYLMFFETARALPGPGLVAILSGGPIRADLLAAVSLGAVFMGAITYIGNGPNFLVKSIAEQSGVRMPTFFGYMAYSIAVLIPLFGVVTLLFLR